MSKKVAAPAPNVAREERLVRKVHNQVLGGFKIREVHEERQVVEVIKVPMQKHRVAEPLKAPSPVPPRALKAPSPVSPKAKKAPPPVPPKAKKAPSPVPPKAKKAPSPVPPRALKAPSPVSPKTLKAPSPVPPKGKANKLAKGNSSWSCSQACC